MAKAIAISKITTAINNCVVEQTARKRNFKELPKAKDARLVPCTNSGRYTDGKYSVKGWNIEVDVDVNGKIVTHDWNVWVVGAGMKCSTARFTDLAKAKAMKKEILTKWGKYEDDDKAKAPKGGKLPSMSADEAIAKIAKSTGASIDDIKAILAA